MSHIDIHLRGSAWDVPLDYTSPEFILEVLDVMYHRSALTSLDLSGDVVAEVGRGKFAP